MSKWTRVAVMHNNRHLVIANGNKMGARQITNFSGGTFSLARFLREKAVIGSTKQRERGTTLHVSSQISGHTHAHNTDTEWGRVC